MGHPDGRLPSGGFVRRTWRRHHRPAGVLLDRKISRLNKEICPAAGARHDLLRIGTGAGTRCDRAANLLVHRFHRRHGEAGPGDEYRWHAEMAYGAISARFLLEGRHEAWLSGRRIPDASEVHAGRPPQGSLALSAVHRVQDGEPEEES